MPDYNKGDFTQQGVDGFVEGGLHLNEKRCLTAKISTDEDSAVLDSVEINIHDHLNDLDYTITGENLVVGENTIGGLTSVTFTENGTFEASHFEAIGWDEVTVNVSGGGENPLLCTFTVVNATGQDRDNPIMGHYYENGYVADPQGIIPAGETLVMPCIAQKDAFDVINYGSVLNGTLSDKINCDFGTGEDYSDVIVPIDATQSCSVTVTLMNM